MAGLACFLVAISATVDQIDKAKELLKKLQFAFRSESFENPVLQQHYANVEAMALDRDSPEEVTDFTCKFLDNFSSFYASIIYLFMYIIQHF